MQIDSIKPTQLPLIRRIKQSFTRNFCSLKTLVKDVFERTPDESKYFVLNGRKIRDKGFLGGPRELPNSVTGPSDLAGISWGRIVFYPEDIEKMKNMTSRERIEFKKKLIEENRFTCTKPSKTLDLSDCKDFDEYL